MGKGRYRANGPLWDWNEKAQGYSRLRKLSVVVQYELTFALLAAYYVLNVALMFLNPDRGYWVRLVNERARTDWEEGDAACHLAQSRALKTIWHDIRERKP